MERKPSFFGTLFNTLFFLILLFGSFWMVGFLLGVTASGFVAAYKVLSPIVELWLSPSGF